jgi:S-DNA-T family DNA segregation ATPase FtsK/SpoIIIE
MLEPLPHVGSIVTGDDDERVGRLLRDLRSLIDERAVAFAAVNAGTIEEFRTASGRPEEPRVLLLLDGFAAFRQEYEEGARIRLYDMFGAIAADGRPVGVHVVITSDRISAIPSSLGSVIQRRLTLRLASETELLAASVPVDGFAPGSPPGRGFLGDLEVQVAVLGGRSSTARQSQAIETLARQMIDQIDRDPATPVGRLPNAVSLGDLPPSLDDRVVIGVGDETLGPAAVSLDDPLLVVGPPRSGKTTALATIAAGAKRYRPSIRLIYVGEGRSPLRSTLPWDEVLIATSEVDDDFMRVAKELEGAPPQSTLVAFDDAPRLATVAQEQAVQDVADAAIRSRQIVLSDGETAAVGSAWGLLKTLKGARHGLALVPDQFDGETVFKTAFPRTSPAEYPPGRGLYVCRGIVTKVQVAVPDTVVP